jgi:hypothetical protein
MPGPQFAELSNPNPNPSSSMEKRRPPTAPLTSNPGFHSARWMISSAGIEIFLCETLDLYFRWTVLQNLVIHKLSLAQKEMLCHCEAGIHLIRAL